MRVLSVGVEEVEEGVEEEKVEEEEELLGEALSASLPLFKYLSS